MNLRPVLRPLAALVLVQVAAQVQALVAVLALALVAAQAQVLAVAPALLRPPLLQVQAAAQAAQAAQAAPVPAHLLLVAVQAARVAHPQVHLPQAAVAPVPHPHLPLVHLQAPRHQAHRHLQVQVALVHLQAQAALRHHPLQALPPVLHPQAHLLQAPHRRAQAVLLHLHQAHRQAVQAQAGILIFDVLTPKYFFALNQPIEKKWLKSLFFPIQLIIKFIKLI